MKKFFFLFLLLGFIFVPVYALASQQKGQGNGSQNGNVNDTEEVLEDDEEDNNTPGERDQERERVQEHKSSTSTPSERGLERRSMVANAVQEMVKVSDRTVRGIGEQVREIAREQNRNFEEVEEGLQKVQKRSRFTRFLVGPNEDVIQEVEEKLNLYEQKITELRSIKDQLTSVPDRKVLEEQVKKVQDVGLELRTLLDEEKKGFSLFGWVKTLLR